MDGNGNETSYQYDVADRIVSVKNANGDTRTYQYNKNGNLTEICDYDGYTLKAKYNGIGQLPEEKHLISSMLHRTPLLTRRK